MDRFNECSLILILHLNPLLILEVIAFVNFFFNSVFFKESKKVVIDATHSMFPLDNYELEWTRWEDDIIWDSENMPFIPSLFFLSLKYYKK